MYRVNFSSKGNVILPFVCVYVYLTVCVCEKIIAILDWTYFKNKNTYPMHYTENLYGAPS